MELFNLYVRVALWQADGSYTHPHQTLTQTRRIQTHFQFYKSIIALHAVHLTWLAVD